MKSPIYKKLEDGRYVCFDPNDGVYRVVQPEFVPPLVPLRLGLGQPRNKSRLSQLACMLAMIEFQRRANAHGDPSASQPYLDKLAAILKHPNGSRMAVRLSWRAMLSAKGHVKAVGEGVHAGRTLYGARAEAALRYQERLGNREVDARGRPVAIPDADVGAGQWRKASTRTREVLKKFASGEHTSEDLAELSEHLPYLPADRLATARSILRAELKGYGRKRLAIVDGLMQHIRDLLDEEDRQKAKEEKPGGVTGEHPLDESIARPVRKDGTLVQPQHGQDYKADMFAEKVPELTKEQAKEVMKSIPAPDKLPEGHAMYFNIDKADATIPIDSLKNLRQRPEGVENAGRFMEGARLGKLPKRDPIKVVDNGDGTYTVADGNSTYANAVKSAWSSMPVKFVGRDFLEAEQAKTREKEIRKAATSLASSALFHEHEQSLPGDVRHPHDTPESLMAAAKKAKPVFDTVLDSGEGVDKVIGGTAVHAGNKEDFDRAMEMKGPVVIIGGLKGMGRATEKVNADYGGDWTRLGDVVRGTVGLDTHADIPSAIEAIRGELAKKGWKIAKKPKNKFERPTDEGYRDINLTFQTDEGLTGEIQINTKAMLKAKDAAHALYERQRTIQANAVKEGRDLKPDELDEYNELVGQQKHIYDTAWQVSLGIAHDDDLSRLLRHARNPGAEEGRERPAGENAPVGQLGGVQRPGTNGNTSPSGSDGRVQSSGGGLHQEIIPPHTTEVPNGEQLARSGEESDRGGVHAGIVGDSSPAVDRTQEPSPGEGVGKRLPGVPDRSGAPGEGSLRQPDRRGDRPADSAGTGDVRTPRKRQPSVAGPARNEHGQRLGGGFDGTAPAIPDPTPTEQVVSEPPAPDNPTDLSAGNFRYPDRAFFASGLKAKFAANLAAIRTLRDIQADGRTTATPEEQAILSKFTGWGQFPGVFNEFWDSDWNKELQEKGVSQSEWNEERGKWSDERDALKSLLSPEEWDAASRSTLNAHYTHPDVVDSHWKIAKKLGFKGGRYLETSAGIGYYLGLMPPELASKTAVSAVELDPTPGAMLGMLYPSADVHVKGFQEHLAPDGFYDLIASNVPFGAYRVHDPDYNHHRANIHDYFFLKSADKVRPGGLVMHITSTGTLDKPDSKIREHLAKSCDLVSAIRFPGGAHKANAGTEVVTDMVILRKRLPGEEPGDRSWLETAEVGDPAGGESIRVNKYFADHPEQILGTLDRTGSMYRGHSVNVSKTEDYEQRLQAAIDRIPEGVMSSRRAPKARFEPETLPAPGHVKDGGFHIKDGKVFVRNGGGMQERALSPADSKRIGAHLSVRDAMRAVINAETAGQDAEPARAELNRVYDAFVKSHGPLSNPKNRRLFNDDPDAPALLALEKFDKKTGVAEKSDIFRKVVVGAISTPDKAANVAEGLGISLHEHGSLDLDHVAKLTGLDAKAAGQQLVEQGLAFEDPSEGWKPADHYLSGNVRRKLALARAAAANDPRFSANVTALEAVQPEDVHHDDIDAKLGSPWIPPADVTAFASKVLSSHANAFAIHYDSRTGEWKAEYQGWQGKTAANSKAAREIWGTKRAGFIDVLNAALNNKMPSYTIEVPGSDPPKKVADREENEAVAQKVQELKDEFRNWVWTDDERRERLHRFYNDNFNNIRNIGYNGQHQKFPGMNPSIRERLHPHIKNFAWQVVTTGKGLAGHEVGTGKTYGMITSAMELRRLGLARKPALLCKKANVDAITRDALDLYPGAKILSTADMFSADKRKQTISRIATGDYDMIIMTHDHADMLKMKPETVQRYIREELDQLEAAYEDAWQASGKDKDDRVVKRLRKAKENLEAKLKDALAEERKDDAVYFEDLGIDQLFVDEAHRYKSLPCYSKMGNIKGVPNSRSDRATGMLMMTRWLSEKNNGRGVVFLTGTPVGNTMPELYNMQRYIQPEELKQRGLDTFDAWASTFGDVETKYERTASGEYKPVTRFSTFTNVPELMNIAKQMLDVQRADDLMRPWSGPDDPVPDEARPPSGNYTGKTFDKNGNSYAWREGKRMEFVIKRPKKNLKVVTSPQSAGVKQMMDDLMQRAKDLKGQKPGKGEDNMLAICSDGRKGSIDLRLLDKDAEDDPESKANKCVANVAETYRTNPGKAQMIFSDLGNHEINGFHLFGDVIQKLVGAGIPREKIVDFTGITESKREQAVKGLRDGTIAVALGSTDTLGTGVNAQDNLLSLHHLDCPWRPADLEQREGRAYRHGNKNQEIHIHNYVTEGSLDEMLWQGIARKARFIRQVMDTKAENLQRTYSEEDTEELTPEQIMAAASGDMRILHRVQLQDDVRKLQNAKIRHDREQYGFASTLKTADARAKDLESEAEHYDEAARHFESRPDFHFEVDGHEFADRGAGLDRFLSDQGIKRKDYDALPNDQKEPIAKKYAASKHQYDPSEALEKSRQEAGHHGWEQEVATIRGMPVVTKGGLTYLRLPSGRLVQTGFSLKAIENKTNQFPELARGARAALTQHHADMNALREKMGQAFPKAADLAEKQKRLKEIEEELAPKKEETPDPESEVRLSLVSNPAGGIRESIEARLRSGNSVSAVDVAPYPDLARIAARQARERWLAR